MSSNSSSSNSSFASSAGQTFDTLKKNAISGASTVATATKQQYQHLTSHPQSMTCSKCATVMPIPSSLWSTVDANSTSTSANWPSLTCTSCGTVTPVPSTEATSILKGTMHTMQAGIHSITDAPTTFHCGYCNTPLLTPMGPWQCQTCTTMNQPTDVACSKCSQSLYDNKVLCGQCGKSTSVPRTGLHDATRSTIAAIQSGAKLVWNSITGTPHAECPRCGTSVALPKTFADQTGAAAAPMSTVSCTQCHHSFPVGGQTLSMGAATVGDHSSTLAAQQAAVNTTTASTPAVSASGSTSSTRTL